MFCSHANGDHSHIAIWSFFWAALLSIAGALTGLNSTVAHAKTKPKIEFNDETVINAGATLVGDQLFVQHSSTKTPRREISGLKCVSPTHCVVVADESIAIQQIIIDRTATPPTYRAGLDFMDKIASLDRAKDDDGNFKETDLEAIAASRQHLYVTGSWGVKRKKGTTRKRNWALWRFPVGSDGIPTSATHQKVKRKRLKALIDASKLLRHFSGRQLQCHGLNIEGLAISGEELLFGLRSPAFRSAGVVVIMRVPIEPLFDRSVEVTKIGASLEYIRLQKDKRPIVGVGIRALEAVGDQIIIVSGDSGVGDLKGKQRWKNRQCGERVSKGDHTNSIVTKPNRLPYHIWSWRPGNADAKLIGEVENIEDHKLEGIAVLPSAGADPSRHDILLIFDGKQADNGNLHIARNVMLNQ